MSTTALVAERESNALRASNPLSPASAHVNAALSDFASSYSNGKLFADRVSPVILVDKKSDSYHKFIQKDATTAVDNRVGDRGAIPEVTIENETDSYTCLGYGLRGPVSRALQATADPAVTPKQRTAKNIMLRNMLQREIRVASQICTSGNWASANTAAATAVWSNQTTGVPLTDIQTAREAVPAGGDDESVLIGICALEVFHDLISHPQIRDLHGTVTGQISAQALANYLGLDELLVSDAQKNTANSGQTVSLSRIWTATVFAMVRVPKQLMGLDQQLFGCTFRRKIAGSSNGILVREWHVENEGTEGTDHLAVTHEDCEKVIQNNQGFLLTSVRS
jgi:hypothetical protein